MLCLRAEVLDDDRKSCTSTDNGVGGFSLPINFGSSIHRYLRKAGAGRSKGSRQWTWSSAFSSDGSPTSDFEDSKPLRGKRKEEKGGKMDSPRYQLEQDVKELQKKLQEEIDLRLALLSAVEHSGPTLSSSPGHLPDEALELLDGIGILEITVSKLEEELIALECQLSQERNERRLAEYRLRHLPSSTSSLLNCSPACSTEPIIRCSNGEKMEEEVDGTPPPIDIAELPKKDYFVENLWHRPNHLSEEMILCMRNIFLILAVSSKISSFDAMAMLSSPQGHLSFSSLTSCTDSPVTTSLMRSLGPTVDGLEALSPDGFFDPYTVPGKVDWRTLIGPYNMAVEVSWLSVGKTELDYAAGAFKRFRLLVEQLARVNPSHMSCNEKLAFWINLYNALIMHAYLAYGVPKSDIKLLSLMQKVAYTVGGHSFSAADIEYTILKMKPPLHCPQLAMTLSLHKFKASEGQKKCSIDHPEPLLAFALSCGMYSSPAVRIFKAGNVKELLMKSMKDYVRASVGIGEGEKLLVPKLLHSFAKGNVEDSLLPEWICQYLSSEQVAMVKDNHKLKWRLLGPPSFTVLPFDSRFRYLFLLEDSQIR